MKYGSNLLVMLLFLSCSSPNETSQEVNNLTPKFPVIVSQKEVFKVQSYIPLKTRVGTEYIFGIDKVEVTNNNIFILQEHNNDRTIFKFDRSGKLVKAVRGSEGSAKIFYDLNDINIVGDHVVVNSRVNKEIIYYDLDLNYEKSIFVPFEEGVQNFYVLNEGVLVRSVSELGVPGSLHLLGQEGQGVKREFSGFRGDFELPSIEMQMMFVENFSKSSDVGSVLYTDFFESIIRQVNNISIEDKYFVNLPDDLWLTKDDARKMSSLDFYEQHLYLNKADKGYYFDQIYESENMLVVSFTRRLKRYFIFLDKSTNTLKSGVVNFETIWINDYDFSPALKYFKGFTDDGAMIFQHNAEEFKLYAQNLEQAIKDGLENKEEYRNVIETAKSIDEYCSTVLAFVVPVTK